MNARTSVISEGQGTLPLDTRKSDRVAMVKASKSRMLEVIAKNPDEDDCPVTSPSEATGGDVQIRGQMPDRNK